MTGGGGGEEWEHEGEGCGVVFANLNIFESLWNFNEIMKCQWYFMKFRKAKCHKVPKNLKFGYFKLQMI